MGHRRRNDADIALSPCQSQATIGSIAAARRAGSQLASRPTPISSDHDRRDHLRIARLHLIQKLLQQASRRQRSGDAEDHAGDDRHQRLADHHRRELRAASRRAPRARRSRACAATRNRRARRRHRSTRAAGRSSRSRSAAASASARQLTDEPTIVFHRLHLRDRQIRIDAPDDVSQRRLPRHRIADGLGDDRHHRPGRLRVRHEDLATRVGVETEMTDVLGDRRRRCATDSRCAARRASAGGRSDSRPSSSTRAPSRD